MIREYNCYYTHPNGGSYAGSTILILQNIKHALRKEFCRDYTQIIIPPLKYNDFKIKVAPAYSPSHKQTQETMRIDSTNVILEIGLF